MPEAEQPADQDQVLLAGQILIDRRQLPREADRSAHRVGVALDVVPEHSCLARVGAQQRGQDPDRRRLAGSVWTQYPVDPSAPNREVDTANRAGLPE